MLNCYYYLISLLVNLILIELEDLEVQENRYIGKLLYLILDLHYLYINNKQFSGLISKKHWPISWPLTDVPIMLTRIGTRQNIQKSTNILTFSGSKKQPATLQSLIADIPTNLWGRDLLMQWGAYVTIPTYPVKLNKS